MNRQTTPDIIIERAVELWCRALAHPRFDNGDTGSNGGLVMALATINAGAAIDKAGDFSAAIERFRTILTDKLKWNRDHHGETTGTTSPSGRAETVYFDRHIGADYGPCKILADAATEAGIPHGAFSWKSDVSLYQDDCVVARFGYAAESVYHYPLKDGRWPICELSGRDMPKIIAAIEDGMLQGFTVEEPRHD
jgi:hypothetical protein